MRTETARAVVAEWLDEFVVPPMTAREVHPLDLPSLSEILAVVGPRRAGKTFYMFQLIRDLLGDSCRKEDILFIDLEDYRFFGCGPADIEDLLAAFYQLAGQEPRYIFMDEVQGLRDWSRLLRTLHNRRKYRLVVSGSNSELLGRELATELRGRCRELMMTPFSLRELLSSRGVTWSERTFHTAARGKILGVFDDYLKFGGYPEVNRQSTDTEKRRVLQSYFRTVFYKDIVERYAIKARAMLEAMMQYCLDCASDVFSISSFEKTIKAAHLPASKRTIANYLACLKDLFFLLPVEKFSFSPRVRMMDPKKIYLLDPGFRMLAQDFSSNKGKALENAVAVELFRRRLDMSYWKGTYECDFVVRSGGKPKAAIQVCLRLDDKTTERELRGLVEAMDTLKIPEGIILTYEDERNLTYRGHDLQALPAWKWLLRSDPAHP